MLFKVYRDKEKGYPELGQDFIGEMRARSGRDALARLLLKQRQEAGEYNQSVTVAWIGPQRFRATHKTYPERVVTLYTVKGCRKDAGQ